MSQDRRVAMISGASRGIGAAIARELHANGWRLSLGCRNPGSSALAPDETVLVPLHGDFDRFNSGFKVALAGVSDQRAFRCFVGRLDDFTHAPAVAFRTKKRH